MSVWHDWGPSLFDKDEFCEQVDTKLQFLPTIIHMVNTLLWFGAA